VAKRRARLTTLDPYASRLTVPIRAIKALPRSKSFFTKLHTEVPLAGEAGHRRESAASARQANPAGPVACVLFYATGEASSGEEEEEADAPAKKQRGSNSKCGDGGSAASAGEGQPTADIRKDSDEYNAVRPARGALYPRGWEITEPAYAYWRRICKGRRTSTDRLRPHGSAV